jgi:outer membrane protein assembly factor BamB
MLALMTLVLVLGGPSMSASRAQQTQQPAPPPVAPVPQLAPKPKPKPPEKPTPPPPKFPSVVKWSTAVNDAPLAPAIVADGRVIYALRSGVVGALHLSDGKEVWTIKLPVDQPLAADGDKIFVVTGEELLALNGADRSTVWKAAIGKPTAPILARGGWVIVASGGELTALRAGDGEKVWSRGIGAVAERPAIDGDGLYVPVSEGHLLALDLKTGDVRWDQQVGAAPTEPLAFGDRIYLGSDTKRFVCLHASSGREAWGWEVGTRIIGPAAADETRVYFTAMNNTLTALSRGNGGRRWKYDLAYRPWRGPVVLGGQVGVPGITTELPGADAVSGKPTGKLTLPAPLAVGPTFVPPATVEESPAVVTITGGQTAQWTISLALPPPDEPPAVPK